MTGLFRSQTPITYILLFFYGLILRLSAFLGPSAPMIEPTDGYLYTLFIDGLGGVHALSGPATVFFAYVLTFIQAIILDMIMNREKMLSKSGHIPAMSYLLVTSMVPQWWHLSAPLLSTTLILPVLSLMSNLMNNAKAGPMLFNAGLLIGISALIHFPTLLMILTLYFSIISMGPFRAVSWVLVLAGFLLPFYYIFSLQFLMSSWDMGAVWKSFDPGIPNLASPGTGLWTIAAIIVPFAAGIWHVNQQVFRMLIRIRKCWNVFSFHLGTCLMIAFLFTESSVSVWFLMIPGMAVFHANAFTQIKKPWVRELLHLACLIAIAVTNLVA